MTNPLPDQPLSLQMSRTYAAPRERVFRAWTEAQALEQWFRPFGMPITVECLELHAGGRYQFNIRQPNGQISSISGQYVEIVQPEKLVYTWISEATDSGETLVTMYFNQQGNTTELTLIHERFAHPSFIPPHQQGWTTMLDALETIFSN